jgi:hypothetical protein
VTRITMEEMRVAKQRREREDWIRRACFVVAYTSNSRQAGIPLRQWMKMYAYASGSMVRFARAMEARTL